MSNKSEILRLKSFISRHIIGQHKLVDRLLLALLADGHLLVEGAPGLAKTRAVKVLGDGIDADFHRVQFTPDLLPADLTGTEIYRPQDASFQFQRGPLFHNLVLADEVNRAPAKVQSALLEAMAERQITVGRETYRLPQLYLVMATQNPIEQEGTYPLPEAQLDRFLLHVQVTYPDAQEEQDILALARQEARQALGQELGQEAGQEVGQKVGQKFGEAQAAPVTQEVIFAARNEALDTYMAENLQQYLIQLVLATRNPAVYGDDLAQWLQYGGSPRATIALDRCARVQAWLNDRDFVAPEDVQAVVYDVLRHRLILNYEAEAEGVTTDQVIGALINRIAVP